MLYTLLKKSKLRFLFIIVIFCFYGNVTKAEPKFITDTFPRFKLPKIPKNLPHITLPNMPGNKKGNFVYDVLYASWVIHSLAEFQSALKDIGNMNSKEYGKKVTVVKTENGSQNDIKDIPQKKITQPIIKDSAEFSNLKWYPQVYFNNQLFPSAVISMAAYQGESPDSLFEAMRRPLGFYIQSDESSFIPLRWEIECVDKSYFDTAGGSFLYRKAGSMCLFNANDIPWNYKALMNTTTPTPVNIYFRLFDAKGNKVQKLVTVTIRSINDCVFHYNNEDLRQLFTAYVQEDDPQIDGILRDALNTKIVTDFVGYQWGSSYVDLQVAAIWKVLHDKGFQYTSIADNSAPQDGIAYSQTVRTFDNSMKTHQANCVDGTVVFASILKRIGIRTILVTVPGHCFLGYYENDSTNIPIHYLETTRLSWNSYLNKDSVNKNNTKLLSEVFPKDALKTATITTKEYLLQFLIARVGGEEHWNEYNEKFPSSEHPGAIRQIDLNSTRKLIQPLPSIN